MAQIESNEYLRYCFRQLHTLSTDLFTYGTSLGPSDKHILNAIRTSNVRRFVSVYGDHQTEQNAAVIAAARSIAAERTWGSLDVAFYDACSVQIR